MPTTLWRAGRVYTPAVPQATALVTDDDTITWVGNTADGPDAVEVDRVAELPGCWIAPAFVDAHVHATSTGLALTGLDLTDAPSLAVALSRVEQAARDARGGAVLGTGWDETRWPERRPPTAGELDRASYGGVVYLARTDVHSAVASSALLAAAPDAAGEPGFLQDGLVRQAAHHTIRRAAYAAVTPLQRTAAQQRTLDRAASLGIACVHECGGPDIAGEDDFLALLALKHPVEVVGYWGELDAIDRAKVLGARGAGGDLFLDGALGSHTACLSAPYADEPTGSGFLYAAVEDIQRHITSCTRAGIQAGFHAIGDAALAALFDAFARSEQEVGRGPLRQLRHRIEHAEMLQPSQLAQMAAHNLVASVQPSFDARWGGPDGMYRERLGLDRARAMNPFAALAAAGVMLALGSDSPVTPLDPWGTVRAAVRHQTAGSGLTPRAAFDAHTVGGRRAAGDDRTGPLVPGAPATFAVWEVAGGTERTGLAGGGLAGGGLAGAGRAGAGLDSGGLPDLDAPDPVCRRTVVRGMPAGGN